MLRQALGAAETGTFNPHSSMEQVMLNKIVCEPPVAAGSDRQRPRTTGSRPPQVAPAGQLGFRRFRDHRDDPADCRRGFVRGLGPSGRAARARCGRRERERGAGRGAPLVQRHRDGLCAGTSRSSERARGRGTPSHGVRDRRRRSSALRERQLRCRDIDIRRDVHAGSRETGQGNASRLPVSRQDRARQLDARRVSSAICSRRSGGSFRRRRI